MAPICDRCGGETKLREFRGHQVEVHINGFCAASGLGPWIDPASDDYFSRLDERMEEELGSNLNEAREWINKNCGSSVKMHALSYLRGSMDFPDWLTLLGDLWCSSDNVGLYKSEILEFIKEWMDDPFTVIPELMSAGEKAAFADLPKQITIYRGCGPQNKCGMSWTLRREIAIRFPFHIRYGTDRPMLLTASINKSRAAALKLERNEHEVIVIDLPDRCWTEELITEPLPLK